MRNKITPPYGLKAFTLSEVLITLVIIGVVAAITIPNIIPSSQNKELYSKYKKNYSVIKNALNLAQVQEGIIGDNTVVFTPSTDNERNYASAKRFAKYLNTMKICKNKWQSECADIYYPVKHSTSGSGYNGDDWTSFYNPKIVLTDGSIYTIYQYETCVEDVPTCKIDSSGNCLKDENGNNIPSVWHKEACALIYVDVNGVQGPNKFGKDNFLFQVPQNDIWVDEFAPRGGKTPYDIIQNKV